MTRDEPSAEGTRVSRPPSRIPSSARIGEPSGTRTRDSLLKRQVLYHLS